MQLQYRNSFKKDLKKLRDKQLKKRIEQVLINLKNANSLDEISNIKKMTGNPFAYRIRIGDYRMGILQKDDQSIEILRILKREDIYKVFP